MMDGAVFPVSLASAAQPGAEGGLVLQSIPLDRSPMLRPLYWRVRSRTAAHVSLALDAAARLIRPPGSSVSFDTYFGAFFEYHWRLYTRLGALTLRLGIEGEARLRIWRRMPDTPDALLLEQRVTGAVEVALPPGPAHFRQGGLLWFDLTAGKRPVRLGFACWVAPDQAACRVGLGVAICTFNREAELAGVLDRIGGHPGMDGVVARVTVVNQGRPGLEHSASLAEAVRQLGSRLRVVEQPNFGGAGGFGRGLIEALDDDAVTHVCFLDDDVVLEPDCLLRMGAFFALAKGDVALGGHMLDAIQPTRLYEAGAVVLSNWALQPLNSGLDLGDVDGLATLLDSTAMHYNGWWMFGFPKHLVHRLGMPLPCFIRGDDVEFGMRLHQQGVFTVPLPGVAIWHEPFYLKIGGWQLYYETRNALLCAALHQPFTPARVGVALLKRLLTQLLTYRYYSAALIVHAMEDALAGPEFLAANPAARHAALAALREAYPQAWVPREAVLPSARVVGSPRWRGGFVLAMVWALMCNWFRPVPADAGAEALDVRDLVWFRVMGSHHLAVETHWDTQRPAYRRDRRAFRRLFVRGAVLTWRLARGAPQWREAARATAATVTTVPFWRTYLGLPERDIAPATPAPAMSSTLTKRKVALP